LYGNRDGAKDILVFQFAFPAHPPAHPFTGLSFLHPLSLSGLKINGVLLDLLDDSFLLDPSLETP
jgi:hypothetical protein